MSKEELQQQIDYWKNQLELRDKLMDSYVQKRFKRSLRSRFHISYDDKRKIERSKEQIELHIQKLYQELNNVQ
jgi:hypothetical protein